ncbi:MAG: family 43 glycosylhydrolase [Bacteroidales bacterium]|nr:family 43 glycosylhydrolase [Bacteroidales bacterium]
MNRFQKVGLIAIVVSILMKIHGYSQIEYCYENQRCPNLGNGYFQNPILGGDYPDPSVLKDGDDYFMTNSSFVYYPGLLIWHSKDLVSWEPVCYALHTNVGSVYAPDFIKYQNKYYIYFPAGGTNWVITANSPEGPWSEPVDLKVGNIDPGHIADEEGNRYLHLSDGQVVRLAPDGLSIEGAIKDLYDGWPIPDTFDVECFCLEAPKLSYRNGYYYLTSAQGGTAGPPTSHMVVSARSKNPVGPWENSPYNPIIFTQSKDEKWWSKGHGTLVDDKEGNTWIIFHGYENGYHTLGRQTIMQPLVWTKDGWFKSMVGQTTDQKFEKPSGETVPHGHKLSDDFSENKMGLQWQFFNEYEPERFKFENEALILSAKGNSLSNCYPMLCVPTNYSYELQTEITIEGGTTAGLTLYYNDRANCGIAINNDNIYVIRHGKPLLMGKNTIGNHIFLKLINKNHIIYNYYSADGKTWIKADKIIEVSGYHHNSFHGFLSLRAGIFAYGKGSAKFEYFTYKGLNP